jgi:hypothetical protein
MMRVIRGVLAGVCLMAIGVAAAGCRQAAGPIPTPTEEQPNKISDIGHDLQNVARAEASAEQDFLDDLDGLDSNERPAALMRQLSQAIAAAVKGKQLGDKQAQDVAQALFVAVTADELNPKQIDQVAADVRASIANIGVDPAAADRVAEATAALQKAITLNPKRWYHFF